MAAASTSASNSTNVRAFAEQAPSRVREQVRQRKGARAVRFLLEIAERYAPRFGARLAVRLWLTIPPARRGAATPDGATPGGATPGGATAGAAGTATPGGATAGGATAGAAGIATAGGATAGTAGIATPGGATADGATAARYAAGTRVVLERGVVAETWGDGPPVYLLHGWAGHRGQFAAFVEPLVSAGFRVVAIDAPGHGESGPGRHGRGLADMLDFIGSLHSATVRYGRAHTVIGHSFGASAVAVAALDGLRADRLVLIAPVANVASGLDFFARVSGVGPRILSRMVPRAERVIGRPAGDFDIALRSAEREELPPALVIHDTKDKEVPFGNGALVAGAWPDGRLVPTEGLGHKRILRDAGLVGTVMSFVSEEQHAVMKK